MPLLPLLVFLLLAWLPPARAAEWFVAPGGDDASPGTLERPFATVNRAQRGVKPGDTVYLRGGVHRPTEADLASRRGLFARIVVLDRGGAPGRPVTYRPYRDEKPVFDCSAVKPKGKRVTAFYLSANWLHVIGLEVTGVQVTIPTHTQSICFENNGSHNVLERLALHDGHAIGVYQTRGANNLYLNCDAWNNWDPVSDGGRGGNVDGFGCHPSAGGTNNVFRGCRAWFNSDDGYDCLGAAEAVVFENCWAMYNGYTPDLVSRADGNGFKAGGYGNAAASEIPNPIPRHVVRRCLAVGNKNGGFYANHHPGGIDWLHNSAFRNGCDFNLLNRLADNVTDVDGYGHRLFNNLSHGSRRPWARLNASACELAGNTFLPDRPASDADFLSLDEKQLIRPRQPDGRLPGVEFLHPAPGSRLVDAGAPSGLPYRGKAPDVGAFER